MRSLLATVSSMIALLAAPSAWAQGWGAGAQGGVQGGAPAATYSYTGPAPAAATGTFGLANQFVLSTNLDIGVAFSSIGDTDGPGDTSSSDFTLRFGTNIGRSWALDYFVIDNLSVGGQITYQTTNDGDDNAFTLAPRVGYNIAFSDDFSLWPQLTVSFTSTKSAVDVGGVSADAKASAFGLGLYAPVLYHITNHFFLGTGPFIDTQLSNSVKIGDGDSADGPKTTNFGLQSVLGGYL
ncbi:MAG: porin family protein [Polyangiaceae bacterium]|jgi:hypothetical protein|nr:porin family protein [Polyangiaceae bacterium]